MLREGTPRRSDGSWSSALHLVPKTFDARVATRALNARTIPERHPVRQIHHDYSHQLGTARYSLPSTSFGLIIRFRYTKTTCRKQPLLHLLYCSNFHSSFCLLNAARTFQSFMDEILMGFDFCFAYIDDILVYSRTPEEHERHLRTLSKQLQAYGILLNHGKCGFCDT